MSTEQSANTLNEFSTKVKILNWIKTTRVQTAMVTALALWIGFITVSPLSVQSAILLGCIGLLTHMWGFTLNEVEDYSYDAKHGEADGHPIAQGKVHADNARYFAWIAGFGAIAISALSPYNIMATVVLAISFVPGYMYNKWSKNHWWSNGYLCVWASLMVLSGGWHAGQPNVLTAAAAAAVGIQIFVQVIEGDLKDLRGPENTFAEKIGVYAEGMVGSLYDPRSFEMHSASSHTNECRVINYPTSFTLGIYFTKAIELGLLLFISYKTIPMAAHSSMWYLFIFMISAVAFFYSLSMFMVYELDRERIKQKSSIHELVSIVVLGIAVMGLDRSGAMLIILAPILWYVLINHTIHSSALKPDI